jgi:tetratricopeptide (TPR) repeat protein
VHPFNGFLLQARASTLLGLDRSAEALVTLNLCEPFAEHEALARNVAALRGQAYITEGRLPEALDAVRDGLARCPRDTKLWFLEAELLAALGELGEAEACLRAQLAFDEDHGRLACADRTIAAFRARALLADILLQRGRPDLAEVESRDVIAVRASFGHAWLTLGEALLEQGRYEELDALCAQLGSSRDAEVGRTVLSALRSSRDGDPERATLAIDQSLGARPGDLMLRKAKTRILAARADRGKALKEAVENVLALDPLCSRTRSIERWLNRKTFGLQAVGHSAPPCSLGPQVL